MKPIIINADYMISPEEIPDVSSSTEIHFTRFGKNQFPNGEPSFTDENSYKIFCHVNEPTTSRWVEPVENIIKHHKKYDKIVTSNPEVLDKCSNAKFMVYGTTWLNKSKHHPDSFGKFTDDLGTLKKELSLSMVCGSLSGKPGYNLRHAIFQNQDKILVSKKFYSSTRFIIPNVPTLPNDDKIHLFNSMYSVAIESTEEVNYFSEKLIDCLITKTIPIYWGCPNISDFFDTSYWIPIQNIFEFKYTEKYYYDNIDKINQNYEKSKIYCKNLFKRIIKL
jgi:hypothetical protein